MNLDVGPPVMAVFGRKMSANRFVKFLAADVRKMATQARSDCVTCLTDILFAASPAFESIDKIVTQAGDFGAGAELFSRPDTSNCACMVE